MATERGRKRGVKNIKLPSGEIVPFPIINEIYFTDPLERHQEYWYTIENTLKGDRDVHVDQVKGTDSNGNTVYLPVERIDIFRTHDAIERAQDTEFSFDNKTGGDSDPPHFVTHQRTHVVRVYQNPNNRDDSKPWIDTELIDEIWVLDPRNRGQETRFTLLNPERNDPDAQITGDETQVDGSDGSDAPVRTDPFQNIVKFNDHQQRSNLAPTRVAAEMTVGLHAEGPGDASARFDGFDINAQPPGGIILANPDFPPGVSGARGVMTGSLAITGSDTHFTFIGGSAYMGATGAVTWGLTAPNNLTWNVDLSSLAFVSDNGWTYHFSSVTIGPDVTIPGFGGGDAYNKLTLYFTR